MTAPIDVLAVMERAANEFDGPLWHVGADLREACVAVKDLVEADREYDEAARDWEHYTNNEPYNFTAEQWMKVASRYEEAIMRRIAAIAKFEVTP